jgi:hypothetical protein
MFTVCTGLALSDRTRSAHELRSQDGALSSTAKRKLARPGEYNAEPSVLRLETFGDLIALHIADMQEVNKPLRRSRAYSLNLLKAKIGSYPIKSLNRTVIITFGRSRAKEGQDLSR